MKRIVQPEILDSLPCHDPRIDQTRRDLTLINALMRNPSWFRRQVFPRVQPTDHMMELGAGKGELALMLAEHLCAIGAYTGIDFAQRPDGLPDEFNWCCKDLLELDYAGVDVLMGNFILHHFSDVALADIGRKINASGIRMLAFNETLRRPLHLWQLRLLYPVICDVTRYDGRVSIEGGFRRQELVEALGLADEWKLELKETFLGSYRLLAQRKAKA
ncbi:hypothetical protein [Cerasicoccus maritimus]|uniref:hypothetical protein n=1 Tax=Cerasicoccus maritimus TaxID=490089 RepID=UPI0028525D8F|nr:hypothetical protein [Cerasicoccus maritimus]